jgi:hypothetical protein
VVSSAWRETETMRSGTFLEGKRSNVYASASAAIAEPHPSMMALFGCLPAPRAGEATPPDEACFCAAHAHFFCRITRHPAVDVALAAR